MFAFFRKWISEGFVGTSVMKRLSVQLSVAGAVLALGAAAVAFSVLSGQDEATEEGVAEKTPEESSNAERVSPITADQTSVAESSTADTSESSESDGTFQNVSHDVSSRDQLTQPPSSSQWNPGASSGGLADAGNGSGGQSDGQQGRAAISDGSEGTTDLSAEGAFASPLSTAPPAAPVYGAGTMAPGTSESVVSTTENAEASAADVADTDSAQERQADAAQTMSVAEGVAEGVQNVASDYSANPASESSSSFPVDGAAGDNFGNPSDPATSNSAPSSNTGSDSGSIYMSGNRSNTAADNAAESLGAAGSISESSNTQSYHGGSENADGSGAASATRSQGNSLDSAAGGQASATGNFSRSNATEYSASSLGVPTGTSSSTTGSAAAATTSSEVSSGKGGADFSGYSVSSPAASSASSYSSAATTAGADARSSRAPSNLAASNVPGEQRLEGEQAPAIVIEKSAPEEIQVNREATFQLRVRNKGNSVVHNVTVVDQVPRGTEFVSATPTVTPTADGAVSWQIDAVEPGEEVLLSMRLLPKVAGEIGSVARATFETQAAVRTVCTKPELKLNVSATQQVLIGQTVTLEITVTNTGNGAAENVVIDEDVPEGFTHPAGNRLEHEIGTLRPQESRRLSLVLESTEPGTYENRMSVRGEGDLFDEDVRSIEVTSPQLQVNMQGPSLRYLDRQATYIVQLANAGTASAHNVELVTHLPKGMKYVTSDNHGQYDTQSHAVYWSLEELPADRPGDVHVTVLPIEPGNHKLKTDVQADLGLQEICEHEVVVESSAELSFIISDVADPIEVGSETTYEIRVQNRGSKAGAEIQIAAELPAGLTPTSGDGPTQGTVQGQQVLFTPLARLEPGEEVIFKIHAQGSTAGDHVVRAQLQSQELTVPVTKEEITRVYTDN